MASDDDDDIMEPDEELEGLVDEDDELTDPDEIELEDDLDEEEGFVALDDEFSEPLETEEDDTEATTAGPVRRSLSSEDDDEDEELIAEDDVEADLDTILKDRLVANEDERNEDDEEPEDRNEPADRLQPRRADEQLCSACFLLVRQSAPVCPVGDDDCPLFS